MPSSPLGAGPAHSWGVPNLARMSPAPSKQEVSDHRQERGWIRAQLRMCRGALASLKLLYWIQPWCNFNQCHSSAAARAPKQEFPPGALAEDVSHPTDFLVCSPRSFTHAVVKCLFLLRVHLFLGTMGTITCVCLSLSPWHVPSPNKHKRQKPGVVFFPTEEFHVVTSLIF